MVFHDPDLDRLTEAQGRVDARSADMLGNIALRDGGGEHIPTLGTFLQEIAGRAPVLIELKDQSGCFGPEPETLAAAVVDAITGYAGPVAAMSFNPHTVAHLARLAPDLPRGLTTKRFLPGRQMNRTQAAHLTSIDTFDAVGASFISHDRRSLSSAPVLSLRDRGVPTLTWTITSPRQEVTARRIARNITFEGYAPAIPTTVP
jgi:glycerophosphoryl diester phosphodiesterase